MLLRCSRQDQLNIKQRSCELDMEIANPLVVASSVLAFQTSMLLLLHCSMFTERFIDGYRMDDKPRALLLFKRQ